MRPFNNLALRILMICMLTAELSALSRWPFNEPMTVYVGPETYYLKRTRKGGSEQTGWLYGGRALYERLIPSGFYWALDGYYAYGCIDGKSSSGKTLKSNLTEAEVEGRLGYSICFKCLPRFSFTPYGGYGGYYGKNAFIHPTTIHCKFHDRIHYASGGFILSVRIKPCWQAAIDFRAKYMLHGKSVITNDPDRENLSLTMNNEWQYELALPVYYQTCWKGHYLKMIIAPFYRYRHFGGMFNFPYDFIDTKLRSYGGRLLVYINY